MKSTPSDKMSVERIAKRLGSLKIDSDKCMKRFNELSGSVFFSKGNKIVSEYFTDAAWLDMLVENELKKS